MNFSKRIQSKIKKELSIMKLLLKKRVENSKDPNFNLKLVQKGFQNRIQEGVKINPKFIERIIESYNNAKIAQKKLDVRFQVGNEWIEIYERYMGSIMKALAQKNATEVGRIYSNFFRETCSIGLHGLVGGEMMIKQFFKKSIGLKDKMFYLYDFLHRYRMWKNLMGTNYSLKDLEVPTIGNPYGYFIEGKFIRSGVDYMHYYATQISRLVSEEKKRKVVVEIGGGYGGMAHFLQRDNSDLTYIDLDLPENMALTAFYLMHALPHKKILMYGEQEITPQVINEYDIILLPNFSITSLPNHSVNLVFNSYSLAEMSPSTIELYISETMRISNDYFFHINHNKNSLVVSDNFNVDLNKFYLMYKAPCLWNMGRNLQMDEFEYLYKRIKK